MEDVLSTIVGVLFTMIVNFAVGAVVGNAIGKRRGWSQSSAILVGGFLGLLGWLILFLYDKRENCKVCGKPFETRTATVCPYCHSNRYASNRKPTKNKHFKKGYTCPNCSAAIADEDVDFAIKMHTNITCPFCFGEIQISDSTDES